MAHQLVVERGWKRGWFAWTERRKDYGRYIIFSNQNHSVYVFGTYSWWTVCCLGEGASGRTGLPEDQLVHQDSLPESINERPTRKMVCITVYRSLWRSAVEVLHRVERAGRKEDAPGKVVLTKPKLCNQVDNNRFPLLVVCDEGKYPLLSIPWGDILFDRSGLGAGHFEANSRL